MNKHDGDSTFKKRREKTLKAWHSVAQNNSVTEEQRRDINTQRVKHK
jgi:hypothetical protein